MHAFVFSFFALLFGVSPAQFILLVVLSQLIQSWQHANLKIHLGPFKYLLISPMYHRMHHAVGYGHEAKGKPGVLGGCNFGVLFPWWDMMLNTAIFSNEVHPTGVRDLVLSSNVLQHQWQSLIHSIREIFPKAK
jgi:sterol desaturase/sphingolipid hydroxylase (fatty acid hydroxylase superfamily)